MPTSKLKPVIAVILSMQLEAITSVCMLLIAYMSSFFSWMIIYEVTNVYLLRISKNESLLKEYSTGTTTAGETAETMNLLLKDSIC